MPDEGAKDREVQSQHQSVGLCARAIEEAGIPTIMLSGALDIATSVTPRAVFVNFPLRHHAGKMDYWAGQTDFQIKTISAWIALAEKRHEEAVQLMRVAAEAEGASDKHPVTPGNVAPSRELLGEMLMTLNSPGQAFAEFERSLKRDPNRFRGIYGAGRTAEASGNREAARDYYAKLHTLAVNRDTERLELAQAKAFLERQ